MFHILYENERMKLLRGDISFDNIIEDCFIIAWWRKCRIRFIISCLSIVAVTNRSNKGNKKRERILMNRWIMNLLRYNRSFMSICLNLLRMIEPYRGNDVLCFRRIEIIIEYYGDIVDYLIMSFRTILLVLLMLTNIFEFSWIVSLLTEYCMKADVDIYKERVIAFA